MKVLVATVAVAVALAFLSVIPAGDLLHQPMISTHTTTELLLAAVATAATAATLTHAAYSPESQLFGRTLIAGNNPNEAALTYDDGPNDAATPALLEVLARHNARATFFMIGRFALERPNLVREVHAAGHLIANHTMTHPWLTMLPAKQVHEELRTCNAALEDITGAPIRYVRFPHGARRPAVLRIARELNLTPVQWNAMGHDWQPIGPDAIEARLNNGLQRARRHNCGANILLHDGYDKHLGADRSATVAVTDQLLQRFTRESTRMVTVDAWG